MAEVILILTLLKLEPKEAEVIAIRFLEICQHLHTVLHGAARKFESLFLFNLIYISSVINILYYLIKSVTSLLPTLG